MNICSHITDIAGILGIELSKPPLIYEYKITRFDGNRIDSVIHHKIYKKGGVVSYTLEMTGDRMSVESVELKTIKQVNDVFCNFIRDSYYDSPILFSNLKKVDDDEFIDYYGRKPLYFYMGLYKNDNSGDLCRVYVRRNMDECYNEYDLM